MSAVRYTLESIRRAAQKRAVGYYEEVIRRGTVMGDVVELTPEDCDYLKEHFTPAENRWPLWAVVVSKTRAPQDRGVGDTIARQIIGGATFKTWFKSTFGMSCGCTERQGSLNQKYPYADLL